jgi:hypothetical protein
LSFLSHWAGTPGQWHAADLIAVTLIVIGIVLQIWALSSMLFFSSLKAEKYVRAVRLFLAGLAIVALRRINALDSRILNPLRISIQSGRDAL